jgi:hypothetical protein
MEKPARILTATLLMLAIASPALAKRLPPPVVKPVIAQGIKYIAPNDQGTIGHVQAFDLKTKKKIWDKVIYRVKLRRTLEEDVQWVFIKSLEVKGDRLLVVNEKGQKYAVRLR